MDTSSVAYKLNHEWGSTSTHGLLPR